MRGETARLEESLLPVLPQLPALALPYRHLDILTSQTLQPPNNKQASVDAALATLNVLTSGMPRSVLDPHLFGLATIVLIQALPADDSEIGSAVATLQQLCESKAPSNPIPCNWRPTFLSVLNAALERSDDQDKWDWSSILANGYMRIFDPTGG